MRKNFHEILVQIQKEEQRQSLQLDFISEAKGMIVFLQNSLDSVKEEFLKIGFTDEAEEIDFFKRIKPNILGKIVYYSKVLQIETACPVSGGKMYAIYYCEQMKKLKKKFKEHIFTSEFYRYYRSGRTDRDNLYFRLGNINFYDGLNSFVFEIDAHFSTYYDYKIAKIYNF